MHPRESFDEDIFCEESCSGLRFDIFTVHFFILLQIVVQYLLSARHILGTCADSQVGGPSNAQKGAQSSSHS